MLFEGSCVACFFSRVVRFRLTIMICSNFSWIVSCNPRVSASCTLTRSLWWESQNSLAAPKSRFSKYIGGFNGKRLESPTANMIHRVTSPVYGRQMNSTPRLQFCVRRGFTPRCSNDWVLHTTHITPTKGSAHLISRIK